MTYGEAGTTQSALGSGIMYHGIPKVKTRSFTTCNNYCYTHLIEEKKFKVWFNIPQNMEMQDGNAVQVYA